MIDRWDGIVKPFSPEGCASEWKDFLFYGLMFDDLVAQTAGYCVDYLGPDRWRACRSCQMKVIAEINDHDPFGNFRQLDFIPLAFL